MSTPKVKPQDPSAGNDLTVDCQNLFNVCRVDGGTYDNGTLTARSSGSIHVQGDLTIKDTLKVTSDHSATTLMTHKVKSRFLEVKSLYASNVNSDDLEATDSFSLIVDQSSTASLFLVLGCGITGSIRNTSTANLWIHWTNGAKPIDVSVDKGSVLQVRDWNGPQ